jgi:hypothetical protein
MQSCRIGSTGLRLPLGSAPASIRRVPVRCQVSNFSKDYSTLDKSALKVELQTRGLSISGGREQLIHRLHLSDGANPPDDTPPVIDDTPAAVEALPTVAEVDIKEKEPAPVKKPCAVRKKKTATAVMTASDGSTEEQAAAAAEPEQLNDATLLKLAKGELQAMAAARGIAKSGTKAQIVARILEGELRAVAAETTAVPPVAAVAAPKKRAAKKKPSTPKKTSTDTEESAISTTMTTIDPYQRPSPLHLSEAASLKRDGALAAPITDPAKLNSKRRVLAMIEESIAVAMTTTAAQNLKWQQQAQNIIKKEETTPPSSASSANPTASPTTPTTAVTPAVSERRRLSADEAAKVLEEVVRRKGTGGVGLGTGNNDKNKNSGGGGSGGNGSPAAAATTEVVVAVAGAQRHQSEVASEVDSMKTVMAGLKARLYAQEENTEQLRASMQNKTGDTTTSPAAASTPTPTPTESDESLQSAIDFALTLGKAVSVVGRGLFNSIMNKKK